MTKQQLEYKLLFDAGHSVTEIARMTGKSKSTISRVLSRARNKKCPFSANCLNCPLDDCAISDEYSYMLNNQDIVRNQHYKGEKDG